MKRAFLCWASVITLFVTLPIAFAENKAINVHFLSGPQRFTQPKVKLQVEGTKLVLTGKVGKKRHTYSLPLEQVTFMSHSPVRFNRARQVSSNVPNVDLPNMGSCSGLGCAGNVLVFFAWGAYEAGRGTAVGVAATQHGRQHFITIDWRDEGVEYELQFESSKDDYSPLIKQLEEASGRKFFDFEARWKQAEADIQREKSHADSVSLKRFVRMGELSLAPGSYSVVALPRSANSAEVYFFEGKRIDSTALRGVALVTISEAKAPSTLKQPEVDYTVTAPTQIKEIRTSTKTLTFASEPAPNPEKESPQVPPAAQQ